MTTHVIARYDGPTTTYEVVEDIDLFSSSYYVRERRSVRIVRGTFSTRRRAMAAAEAEVEVEATTDPRHA